MSPTEREKLHLEEANRHIAAGEKHVAHQKALVEQLTAAGHDTVEAEKLLTLFIQTLQLMYAHHAQILRALAEERS